MIHRFKIHDVNVQSAMRVREFAQTEEIGKVKAELAVEKSRSTAWKEQIETLKVNLEETKRDINLSQSAIQGSNEYLDCG